MHTTSWSEPECSQAGSVCVSNMYTRERGHLELLVGSLEELDLLLMLTLLGNSAFGFSLLCLICKHSGNVPEDTHTPFLAFSKLTCASKSRFSCSSCAICTSAHPNSPTDGPWLPCQTCLVLLAKPFAYQKQHCSRRESDKQPESCGFRRGCEGAAAHAQHN
jgi:hypothetical protein